MSREAPYPQGKHCAVGKEHICAKAEEPAWELLVGGPHEDAGQLGESLVTVFHVSPLWISP